MLCTHAPSCCRLSPTLASRDVRLWDAHPPRPPRGLARGTASSYPGPQLRAIGRQKCRLSYEASGPIGTVSLCGRMIRHRLFSSTASQRTSESARRSQYDEERGRTLRIQATATRITAVPGPLISKTSAHGAFGSRHSGTRRVCQRAAKRVLVAETRVDMRDSPTARARGRASRVWSGVWSQSISALILARAWLGAGTHGRRGGRLGL